MDLLLETLAISSQLCLKFGTDIKEMGWLKKENLLLDQERHQSVSIEKLKRCLTREKHNKTIEKQMKNKGPMFIIKM